MSSSVMGLPSQSGMCSGSKLAEYVRSAGYLSPGRRIGFGAARGPSFESAAMRTVAGAVLAGNECCCAAAEVDCCEVSAPPFWPVLDALKND